MDPRVEGGEPRFLALYVALVPSHSDAHNMTTRLDTDEVQNLQIPGLLTRGVNLISESWLYEAILGSHKAEAKRFKRWVKREVLPTIRKTGSYSLQPQPQIPQSLPEALRLAATLAEEKERLAQENAQLTHITSVQNDMLEATAPKAALLDQAFEDDRWVNVTDFASRLEGVNRNSLTSVIRVIGGAVAVSYQATRL
ncbi:Bro-N domain-containing protein [Thiorhodococcus fuscus]|uniref:Bro-N domain-containing protein n=1 Tax=Thiorhodococcus fuscus TaxID=527200 RepID=A0ABW4Y5C0_9GAMM